MPWRWHYAMPPCRYDAAAPPTPMPLPPSDIFATLELRHADIFTRHFAAERDATPPFRELS
jgi:hypothetical protein